MKALAGPAMLLVIVGGFTIYKATSKSDMPSRKFTELELAADDDDHTGTCYSLSTVLIANTAGRGDVVSTWSAPDADNDGKWAVKLEAVYQGPNGPVHRFQTFTFEKFGEQVRLVEVDASDDLSTDIAENIDGLLEAPHDRKSTPVERCLEDGGTGYKFKPRK